MKNVVCILALVSSAACANSEIAKTEESFNVQGMSVYVESGIVIDQNQVMNAVDGFNEALETVYPEYKSIPYSNIHLHIVNTIVKNVCDGSNCAGLTVFHADNSIDIYVVNDRPSCFSNSALAHELTHVMLQANTGDAGGDHADAAVWHWMGFLMAAVSDGAVTCASGPDFSRL